MPLEINEAQIMLCAALGEPCLGIQVQEQPIYLFMYLFYVFILDILDKV